MKKIKSIFKYAFLTLITLIFLFPVIYMLACSFMSSGEVNKMLDFTNGQYKSLKLSLNKQAAILPLNKKHIQNSLGNPDFIIGNSYIIA